MRGWVVEASQEYGQHNNTRRTRGDDGQVGEGEAEAGFVVRMMVGEVRGSGEGGTGNVVLVRTMGSGREGEGRKWMLMGSGKTVRRGMAIGVRAPVWEVEVLGERWGVGVEWKVIGDG